MKLTGRIPVEPLDDDRLTKLERRVVVGAADAVASGYGAGAPRRILASVAAAVALAAAGAIGWALHGGQVGTPVIAEPVALHVMTSPQRALLDLGDARIESDPATEFVVTRPAGGVLVALTRGKVELEVGKRGDRPPLIVRAGDTEVVVVGTHFTVDYGDGHGEVDVRVTEGVVRIVHDHRELRVAAGQAWQTRAGLTALAALSASPPGGQTLATGEPPATGEHPATGEVATALGEPPRGLHDRKAVVPEAPASSPGRPRSATAHPRVAGGEAAPRARPVASDPQVDLRMAIRAQPVEPALDLAEPDPAAAVARYYDIAAHRSGDEASQAFYSIAVVRHVRLGRNADALQALDAYVRRFPGGKQYRAALWLRVRILCLDKLDDRCRAAAYTYLHEAPDGPAARVAEQLTLTE